MFLPNRFTTAHAPDPTTRTIDQKTHEMPPRHRMTGGDLPRGGNPLAPGHAGLARLGFTQALAAFPLFVLLLVCACVPVPLRAALADTTTVKFENGGTAKMDGNTITGTCGLKAKWSDANNVTFDINLPDGQTLKGHCIDYGAMVPENADFPFTATKGADGTYSVRVNSQGAARYQDWQNNLSDGTGAWIQRIEADSAWTPRIVRTGKLTVFKRSQDEAFTSQTGFSVANAHYGVYKDSSCAGTPLGSMTTNNTGTSSVVELEQGSYWVKETTASCGYLLDQTIYPVTIKAGETTTLDVIERPAYCSPDVWVTKRDPENSQAPVGTLAGMKVKVCYYKDLLTSEEVNGKKPTRTWILVSDENGLVIPDEQHKADGDEFYTNAQGKVIVPYGTLSIQETEAPAGYFLHGQTATSPDGYQSTPVVRKIVDDTSFTGIIIKDKPMHGGVRVKKVLGSKDGAAQGAGGPQGAVFSLVNDSQRPLVHNNRTYEQGAEIATITTDDKGIAQTGERDLPCGSYVVREKAAPTGYRVNEQYEEHFTIEKDSVVVDLTDKPCVDEPLRGGIGVRKVSRETLGGAQGGATLAGAKFEIKLGGTQDIAIDKKTYKPGDVVATIKTDENGYAATKPEAFPYGTYVITETEAPKGYLLDKDWSCEVAVTEHGVIHEVPEDKLPADQVIRGDFHFKKLSAQTLRPLADIPFLVTSSQGEQHVLGSDANGVVCTSAAPHANNTNVSDAAYVAGADEESSSVDESALDAQAGVWFSGSPAATVQPNDKLGALPYDTYQVQELRCAANEGFELESFTIIIGEQGTDVDAGTVHNKHLVEPTMGTTLTYANGSHCVPVANKVELTDTVAYTGLEPGAAYTLSGELRVKGSKEGDDPVATATKSFTPTASNGSADVQFEVDTSELEGKSLVCYETLSVDSNPDFKLVHQDDSDEDQTVHFPSLTTTLADVDGNKATDAAETITLRDTVHYTNLVPGESYVIRGTLMCRDTDKALVVEEDKECQASVELTPTEASGEAVVEFTFPGSVEQDTQLVAFETLMQNDLVLVSHENLEDKDQTVTIRVQKPADEEPGEEKTDDKGSQPKDEASKSGSDKPNEKAKTTSDKPAATEKATRSDEQKTPKTGDYSLRPGVFLVLGSLLLVAAALLYRVRPTL